MSKQDRIAIAATLLYLLFPVYQAAKGNVFQSVIIFGLVIAYWGYRFIKNDISFFSNKSNAQNKSNKYNLSKNEIEFLHMMIKDHGAKYHGNIDIYDNAYASLRKKLRLWEAENIVSSGVE